MNIHWGAGVENVSNSRMWDGTMGERIIECGCGRAMRVPESALGGAYPCIQCGAELAVTLENSVPATPPTAENAPRPNVRAVEPGRALAPALADFDSDGDAAEPPPWAEPASGFSDGGAPDSAGAPRGGAAAFRGEEAPIAAPPPDTVDAFAPDTPEEIAEAWAPPIPRGSVCARCGRAFRGEWDIIKTAGGALCNVCAHQAEAVTEGPKGIHAHLMAGAHEKIERPKRLPDPPARKKKINLRGPLLYFAFVAVAMTVILALPVEEYIAEFFNSADAERAKISSFGVRILLYFLEFVLGVAGQFVQLYVTLSIMNKLLFDNARQNILHVLSIAVVLGVLSFALGLLPAVFFAGLLMWIVRLYIVSGAFNFEIDDLIKFFIVGFFVGLLVGPMTLAAEKIAYGLAAGFAF